MKTEQIDREWQIIAYNSGAGYYAIVSIWHVWHHVMPRPATVLS